MRTFRIASLFAMILIFLCSCKNETSEASIKFTVISPEQTSEHGYSISDLSSCKIELFSTSGKHHVFSLPANSSYFLDNLRNGNYAAQAYGYDTFGTAIASSGVQVFLIDGETNLSKELQLEWRETGKEENQLCFVKFNTNGGSSIPDQKVKSGSTVEEPATSKKKGYTLEGWYWNSALTSKFDFSTPISWGITLHAKWEISTDTPDEPENPETPETPEESDDDNTTYTVRVLGLNGKLLSEQTVKSGDRIAWFDFSSEDGEYVHWGWYYDSEYTNWADLWDAKITSDTTFYSKWIIPCKVTFYKNYGSNQEPYITNHEPGYDYWLPYNYMFEEDDSHYFLGWATTSSATTPEYYTDDRIEALSESMELYAVWTSDYITITLKNSYIQSEKITKKVGKDSKVYLSNLIDWNNPFTGPKGYQQNGFSTKAQLTQNVDYPIYTTDTLTSDQTFFAIWQLWIVCHENHYDDYGNEYCNWYTYYYGNPISRPDYTPYYEGHTFEDWYTSIDFTQTVEFSNLSGADADDSAQIHVYAKWHDLSHISGITVNMESLSEDALIGLTLSGNTFTAASGFASYLWKLDGVKIPSASSNSYMVDESTVEAGIHYVTLVVTDERGTKYSARTTITIEKE